MSIDPQHNEKDTESPPLHARFVEPILQSCLNGSSYYEIIYGIQNKTKPIDTGLLKSYLFYLIEFNLISYDGLEQLYLTEEKGLELLSVIDTEKNKQNPDDFFITLEKI